jgi:hypothetical protein
MKTKYERALRLRLQPLLFYGHLPVTNGILSSESEGAALSILWRKEFCIERSLPALARSYGMAFDPRTSFLRSIPA